MHSCFGSIQINCLCEIVRDCCMHNNCIFFKIKLFFFNYLGRDEHSFWITRDCTKRKGNLMRWNQRNCPSLSRPFFFTRLFHSMIFFNFPFFSRYICQEWALSLLFLLYSEGGGNAAIFLWSCNFMSRSYRVGKLSFVSASNQAFIVYWWT